MDNIPQGTGVTAEIPGIQLASVNSNVRPLHDATAGSEFPRLPEEAPWPRLQQLGLSEAQRVARSRGIGGSDANIILSGDRDKVLRLWREKRDEAPTEDLSANIAVMLGCWTESFNRQWFERVTELRVTAVGQSAVCSKRAWRHCTLDGLVESRGAVWEAKHTNAFTKPDEVLERYMPQLQHNMAVTGTERAMLSVIFGNHKFEVFDVAADWLYQLDLLAAEEQFWDCVASGKEPLAVEPLAPPKPIGTREVCLEGNNCWASAALDWLQHRTAAKTHSAAITLIKSLVEDDVARAFGHGVEAKRSKSGAITIRELKL